MNMRKKNALQNTQPDFVRLLTFVFVVVGLSAFSGTGAFAQQSTRFDTRHYMYDYELPPGEIAFRKTLARQSMVGYFQPVQLKGSDGIQIDVFSEGSFRGTTEQMTTAGLMVGHIYRLKVTNIPGHPGKELYPSVEIIGRLFPPEGQEVRFPIPVNIGLEDLEPAMNGALVTRVIYLENPRTAIAEQRDKDDQPFFDVGIGQDPIRAAEKLGRPMAIVRIGSRIPDAEELNAFGFGTPPMIWFDSAQMNQLSTPDQLEPSNIELPETSPDGTDNSETMIRRDPSARQVGYQEPVQNPVQNQQPGSPATAPNSGDAIFAQAEPMFQVPPWPDELLIDGGDRDLTALVKDHGDRWEVRGLESEDTIGHFDTLDGRRIVDTSNRVTIYSPRFAAVRKIDNLGRTQYTNLLGRVDEEVVASTSNRTDFSTTTLQHLQPTRHKRMMQAVGIENQTRGLRIDGGVQMKLFEGNFKTFENLRLIKTGFFDNREKGRLSIAIQRAIAWESDVSAQSTTRNMHVIVVADAKQAQESIHIKTEFNRPQLRLVKIASVEVAHPGDFVEFTIRFDNVGDQPIGNVTILDNLTGRLGYVEDSAECSIPGTFITEPNSSGSTVLRWEITDPLQPTKGGVIRFKCRVR